MLDYILVMIGGATWGRERDFLGIGIWLPSAAVRFSLWAHWFVNITGSFAIGFFAAFTNPEGSFSYVTARFANSS